MKKIRLSNGKAVLVDDDDYDELNKYNWHMGTGCKTKYAARHGKKHLGERSYIPMHRQILNVPNDLETDHIDMNGLNNQKSNLRVCTKSQNAMNRGKPNIKTSSKFKGVSWKEKIRKWQAYIKVEQKWKHLGVFKNQIDAAVAYNQAAIKYHGEFARLNEISGMGV